MGSLLESCRWIRNILYTEEAHFTSDGVNKTRNSHLWDLDNPHGSVESDCQHPFSIHVCCGDQHIGSYFFFRNVTRVIFTQMFCVMNSQPSQRMFLCKHDIRFTTGAQSTLSFQSGHQAVSELAIPQTNRLVVAVHIIGLHSHRI